MSNHPQQQPQEEETWETGVVYNWLQASPDEALYRFIVSMIQHTIHPAQALQAWVEDGNAPQGLYDEINDPKNKASLKNVQWKKLVRDIKENEGIDLDEEDFEEDKS